MALIEQTSSQYYEGEQLYQGTGSSPQSLVWPSHMLPLVDESSTTNKNFKILIDGVESLDTYTLTTVVAKGKKTQTISFNNNTSDIISIKLVQGSIWDDYGNYSYTKLKDVINNFMVAYVGLDKIIPRVNRTDVIFHAKRGLQEFSYDTLKSVKSIELSVPPSLSTPIPQDYVNYVQLSYIDSSGIKRIIYPTRLTLNPYYTPIQDDEGMPTQDMIGEMVEGSSITNDRWESNRSNNITGEFNGLNQGANVYSWDWWKGNYGQRYGLNPETSQKNGWFTIDDRQGKLSFSSDLAGQIVLIEYISDGLAYDLDSRIPKMAEDALYSYILYNIAATRANFPEYIVQRYKREKVAKLRNAKIRLSNIKLEEFTQVMRGKSKWIKH